LYDIWFTEQNHIVNINITPFSSFPTIDQKIGSGSRLKERRFECGKRSSGDDKKSFSNPKDVDTKRATGLNTIDWTKKSKQLWQNT